MISSPVIFAEDHTVWVVYIVVVKPVSKSKRTLVIPTIAVYYSTAMDVSADLTELTRCPVGLVSAGVKSILDIGRYIY